MLKGFWVIILLEFIYIHLLCHVTGLVMESGGLILYIPTHTSDNLVKSLAAGRLL